MTKVLILRYDSGLLPIERIARTKRCAVIRLGKGEDLAARVTREVKLAMEFTCLGEHVSTDCAPGIASVLMSYAAGHVWQYCVSGNSAGSGVWTLELVDAEESL